MRKTIVAGLAALLCLSCSQKTPQDRLTVNDKKIDKIIAQMTLEEKVEMLHSKTIMSSEGVPRLGIQDIKYADGPFGVREEVADGFRPKGWTTDSATYSRLARPSPPHGRKRWHMPAVKASAMRPASAART